MTPTPMLTLSPAAAAVSIAAILLLLAFANMILYGHCCPGCGGRREHHADCPLHKDES